MDYHSGPSSAKDGQKRNDVSRPNSSSQPQPQGQPRILKQPQPYKLPHRATDYLPERVMDEIMDDNLLSGYASQAQTLQERAKEFKDFVGSAHYYILNKPKSIERIHGEYVIVYARPLDVDTDAEGNKAYELFKPNARNSICIYTKHLEEKTAGHRKVNELLDQNLLAVGMMYHKAWNMTLWITKDLVEHETTSKAQAVSPFRERTNAKAPPPKGELERRLWHGPEETSESNARVSFGATPTVQIENMDGKWVKHGFEFITVQFPSFNQVTRVYDDFLVVAVKMPPNRDVSSSFLLVQKLFAPLNTDCMTYYKAEDQPEEMADKFGEKVLKKHYYAGSLETRSEKYLESTTEEEPKEKKGKGKEVEVMDVDVDDDKGKKRKGKEVAGTEVMDVDDNSDADTIKP